MSNLNLGAYLKDLRLRKGYSLERLCTETKISLSILKKLENNELATLPNITYVKGYVQNILKTLHVTFGHQEMEIINKTYIDLGLLKPTIPLESVQSINTENNQSKAKSESSSYSTASNGSIYNIESLKSKRIVLSVLFVLIILGIFRFVQKINQQPDLRQSQAQFTPSPEIGTTLAMNLSQTPTSEIAVIAQSTPTISGEINPTIAPSLVPTGTATPLPTVDPSKEATASSNYPRFEFKKITNLAVSIDSDAADNNNFEIYTAEDRRRTTTGKENVFVTKTEGESWITYKKNTETPKSFLLKTGQKFYITGDKIFLTIGNTLGLKVFHNGKLVRFADTNGVKSFIFPLTEATEHSLPLFVKDGKDKLYFYQDYIPLMNQEPTSASAEGNSL